MNSKKNLYPIFQNNADLSNNTINNIRSNNTRLIVVSCALAIIDLAGLIWLIVAATPLLYLILPIALLAIDIVLLTIASIGNYRIKHTAKITRILLIIIALIICIALPRSYATSQNAVMTNIANGVITVSHLLAYLMMLVVTFLAKKKASLHKPISLILTLALVVPLVGASLTYTIVEGYWGQQNNATIVYKYETEYNCYTAQSILSTSNGNVVIPETFNGVPVTFINAAIFATDNIKTIDIEGTEQRIIRQSEYLPSVKVNINVNIDCIDDYRLQAVRLYKDYQSNLFNCFYPVGLQTNEVFVLFRYQTNNMLTKDLDELIPTQRMSVGGNLSLEQYFNTISYLNYRDTTSQGDLAYNYTRQSKRMLLSITDSNGNNIVNTKIQRSTVATVKFDKVVKTSFIDGNDTVYQYDNALLNTTHPTGEYQGHYFLQSQADAYWQSLPSRESFHAKWMLTVNDAEFGYVDELSSYINSDNVTNISLQPTWSIDNPIVSSISCQAITYGNNTQIIALSQQHSLPLTYELFKGNTPIERDNTSGIFDVVDYTPEQSGLYTVKVYARDNNVSSLSSETTNWQVTLTVNKAELNFDWSKPSANDSIYDGNDKSNLVTCEVNVSDIVNNNDSIVFSVQLTDPHNSTTSTLINAGQYKAEVVLDNKTAQRYKVAQQSQTITVSIAKASLTVTASHHTLSYGDNAPSYTVSYSGFVNGETASVLTTAPRVTSLYTTTTAVADSGIAVIASGAEDDNYQFVYVDGAITIYRQRVAIPTAGNTQFVYSGNLQTYVPSQDNRYTITGNQQTNAGQYTAIVNLINANYEWVDGSTEQLTYEWSIGKAVLTITASSHTVIYGDNAPIYTVSYSGFVNGETASVLTTASSVTSLYTNTTAVADSGIAVIASGAEDDNYQFVYVDGAITINIQQVAIPTADTTTFVYNGVEQTYSLADNEKYTIAGNKQTNAGEYSATAQLNDTANYKWTDGSIRQLTYEWTIGKAELTITASSHTVSYGDNIPSYTVSYSGFVNGETASVLTTAPRITSLYTTTTAVADSGIAVTASGADASNYNITYIDGSITINIQQVAIPTADTTTFVYNGVEQTYSLADNEKYTIAGNKQTNAGEYSATAQLNDTANYEWTDGSIRQLTYEWTIGKAALTITASSHTVIYGDNAPIYTVSYSGFVNGETASVLTTAPRITSLYTTTTAVADSGIAVTASGADASNYNITYIGGSITINSKPVELVWSNNNLVHNGQPQTALIINLPQDAQIISYAYYDSTDTVTPLQSTPSAVGHYIVVAVVTSASGNYTYNNCESSYAIISEGGY